MKKFKLMGVLVFVMALAFTVASYVNVDAEVAGPGSFENFTTLKIPQGTTAKRGEKVYVKLYADVDKIDSIQVVLGSSINRDAFMVELYDIKTSNLGGHDAYFILPDNITEGDTIELLDVLVQRGNKYESYSTTPSTNGGSAYMNVGDEKYVTIKTTTPISLSAFESKDSEISLEDGIIHFYVSCSNNVKSIVVFLTNKETGKYFLAYVQDLDNNPHIKLSQANIPVVAGTYRITEVMLMDDSNNKHEYGNAAYWYTHYNDPDAFLGDSMFGSDIVIKAKSESTITLKQFKLSKETVKIGDTVNVTLNTNKKIESAMLSLYNETANDSMTVYLKDAGGHYTFVVPSTVVEGKYIVENLILRGTNGETTSLTVKDSDLLNTFVTVKQEKINTKTVVFNNDSYSNAILNNIRLSDDNAVITVTADTNSIIAKEIFEAIANTKRTLIVQYKNSEWVFNGIDIKNPKDIDASMLISEISSEDFYESKVAAGLGDNTMLLKFADNGNLPGKVLIRLKSEKLDKIFKEESIFVYFYDKDVDSLYKVATEVHKTNGYYEFYINHNSSYVLSGKKIDDSYVSEDTNRLDLNKEVKSDTKTTEENKDKKDSDDTYKIVAGVLAGVVVVLAGALVIPKVIKKKNKISE